MKCFLTLVLLCASYSICAQNLLPVEWSKSKKSPVNGEAEGWGIDLDKENNIYWPVSFDSVNQGLDIICYKFDPTGKALWNTPFFLGGVGVQHNFVCNAKDTALYLGGRSCPIQGFSCDMQLIKVNKQDGSLIWEKKKDFGQNGYDEIDGLIIKEDGIYCSGWAQAYQSGAYQIDMGFWKLDFDGNTKWVDTFGKAGTAEHQDGHFVVDDSFMYGAGLWGGTSISNLYNGHAFIGKFSKQDGHMVDSSLFGHQSNDFLDIENALGMATDGTYLYVTGYTTPNSANNWQVFIAKFDKNLNQIWYRDWGDTGTETARAIAVENGKIYVGGITESPNLSQGGNGDALLLQYDTDGNLLKYYTWGDTLDEAFQDIVVKDGDVYLSGTISNKNPGGKKTAFMLKVNANSIDIPVVNKSSVVVYPNPLHSSEKLVIDQGKLLGVYDMNGKELSSQMFTSRFASRKPGIYVLKIREDENETLTTFRLTVF